MTLFCACCKNAVDDCCCIIFYERISLIIFFIIESQLFTHPHIEMIFSYITQEASILLISPRKIINMCRRFKILYTPALQGNYFLPSKYIPHAGATEQKELLSFPARLFSSAFRGRNSGAPSYAITTEIKMIFQVRVSIMT